MASRNLASRQIAAYLDDHNLSPEDLGELVGLSGMTIRRTLDPDHAPSRNTRWILARRLGEDPSSLWPVRMPGKRQPGGPRRAGVAA